MEKINDKLLNWASLLETAAREQAEQTSALPFIHPHVALMPDAHHGKGATVGSVIPTDRAIIPAAVGVDIGCVDADTEYLSPAGWRKISEYDGGLVMDYDVESGTGRFVQPSAYIVKPCTEFYRLRTKYGVDQKLSPDHRVLVWKITGRKRTRVPTVVTAEAFANEHDRLVQGVKAEFATTFTPVIDTKLPLSDAQLRVQVMVHADGHLLERTARVHFRKPRKIERARLLLKEALIRFTEFVAGDGTTFIEFAPPMMTKSFAGFWSASPEQLTLIAEECLKWDGNEESRCYYSRDRASADFIHYAFTATGRRAVLRVDEHSRDGGLDYRVFAHDNTMVGIAGVPKTPVTREASADGLAYCFTLTSGYWVMRRNGNIAMTGNCGMNAVLTQFHVDQFRERGRPLSELREAIERAVPLGAGRYNRAVTGTALARIHELEALEAKAGFQPGNYAPNWHLQLGSLGSGNHFIEVTADEQGRVWLFLHSGSRGVGNRIANKHIRTAAELCDQWWVKLPNPELAYLPEGTDEFWRYIRELRWAQQFALLNRAEMMDRVADCVSEWMGETVQRSEEIACHHNYSTRERHFGREVWVSRKGAINAEQGVLGLIPGSMGTASYVVMGKGNPLSLNSSPHGAGRQYSRRKARETFTHDQLREAMRGIEYRDTDAFLDEIPGAYKDIDVVLADAHDLVAVRHTLRQFVNVKGD